MHSFKFLAHYNSRQIKILTLISMSYIHYEPQSLIKCDTDCKEMQPEQFCKVYLLVEQDYNILQT